MDIPVVTRSWQQAWPPQMTLDQKLKRDEGTYVDFGAGSRYLRQGLVIASHRVLWDAITCPCLKYLLLSPKSSYCILSHVFFLVIRKCSVWQKMCLAWSNNFSGFLQLIRMSKTLLFMFDPMIYGHGHVVPCYVVVISSVLIGYMWYLFQYSSWFSLQVRQFYDCPISTSVRKILNVSIKSNNTKLPQNIGRWPLWVGLWYLNDYVHLFCKQFDYISRFVNCYVSVKHDSHEHIKAETKRAPFPRQHFQMHFFKYKCTNCT